MLGFSANDFARQEPGSEEQIKDFCSVTYGVDLLMFSKARVGYRNAGPFYRKLAETSGTYPQWSFHKYLAGSDGKLVANYKSAIDPLDPLIVKTIKTELKRVKLSLFMSCRSSFSD